MTERVEKALTAIDMTYANLIEIANDIFSQTTAEMDAIIREAYNNIEDMTNDYLRDLMLRLSLKSYTFSEIKERSAFKAVVGEMLRKEAYATAFNSAEGSVAARENNAVVAIGAEALAEEIYSLVASMLKVKSDECHRVVDTLKSVLMTRLQEAKLTSVDTQ